MRLNTRKFEEFYIMELTESVFHRSFINELKQEVRLLIENNAKNIIFDLSKVEKIDGVGFGVLLAIQKMTIFHDVNIKLFGLQPEMQDLFNRTGMGRVINICKNADECEAPIEKAPLLSVV